MKLTFVLIFTYILSEEETVKIVWNRFCLINKAAVAKAYGLIPMRIVLIFYHTLSEEETVKIVWNRFCLINKSAGGRGARGTTHAEQGGHMTVRETRFVRKF